MQPTVFANASNNMRIAREEIFGPVPAPFGGFKASGVGREFGKEGQHYVELKTIIPPGGGIGAAS